MDIGLGNLTAKTAEFNARALEGATQDQVYHARVLETTSDGKASIRIGDKTIIVETDQQLQPNSKIDLMVKGFTRDSVQLAVVGRDSASQSGAPVRALTNEDISSRLIAFEIPDTEQNVRIARSLSEQGLPVTKELIFEAADALKGSSDPKDISFITSAIKEGIPVETGQLAVRAELEQALPKLPEALTQDFQNLRLLADHLAEQIPDVEKRADFLAKVEALFVKPETPPAEQAARLPEAAGPFLASTDSQVAPLAVMASPIGTDAATAIERLLIDLSAIFEALASSTPENLAESGAKLKMAVQQMQTPPVPVAQGEVPNAASPARDLIAQTLSAAVAGKSGQEALLEAVRSLSDLLAFQPPAEAAPQSSEPSASPQAPAASGEAQPGPQNLAQTIREAIAQAVPEAGAPAKPAADGPAQTAPASPAPAQPRGEAILLPRLAAAEQILARLDRLEAILQNAISNPTQAAEPKELAKLLTDVARENAMLAAQLPADAEALPAIKSAVRDNAAFVRDLLQALGQRIEPQRTGDETNQPRPLPEAIHEAAERTLARMESQPALTETRALQQAVRAASDVRVVLAQLLNSPTLSPDARQMIQSFSQNVQFANVANALQHSGREPIGQLVAFIPLQFEGKTELAQLRVFTREDRQKGKPKRLDPENASLALILTTPNLGKNWIHLTTAHNQLNCKIETKEPKIRDLFKAHLKELREGLEALDFQFGGVEVDLRKEQKKELEFDAPAQAVQPSAIDIHA